MASPSERLTGKALRPRPRFEGRSPAAIARRCGAILALLALAGCQRKQCQYGSAAASDGGRRSTFEPVARPQRPAREALGRTSHLADLSNTKPIDGDWVKFAGSLT